MWFDSGFVLVVSLSLSLSLFMFVHGEILDHLWLFLLIFGPLCASLHSIHNGWCSLPIIKLCTIIINRSDFFSVNEAIFNFFYYYFCTFVHTHRVYKYYIIDVFVNKFSFIEIFFFIIIISLFVKTYSFVQNESDLIGFFEFDCIFFII